MLEILIITALVSTIVSVALFFLTITDCENYKYYYCPQYIYDNSTFNVFGVLLMFLLMFIMIPLYYLLWFGYWICHVGRKDNYYES